MTSCTVCNNHSLKTIIDFGLQPPANRFLKAAVHTQDIYPLSLGYCGKCGTAQLTKRMPIDAIRPQYEWLLYNEPEGHLDEVAKELIQLLGVNQHSQILGVTYKDQSTINRLKNLGIQHGACISESDFAYHSKLFGLETIQHLLQDANTITHLKGKYGTVDILIMRHVIEHAYDAAQLILNVRHLIKETGYLVMELPDSEHIFQGSNHAFIWEEHISYFTEQSLYSLAQQVGAQITWFKRCSYPYEDSLLVAFRFFSPSNETISNNITHTENMLEKFNSDFIKSKNLWRAKLETYKQQNKKIAIFGAGHLATKFINFLNLGDLINCVIDDHPHKKGMKMPGSLLPIVSSENLIEKNLSVCISTLSPESEIKVRNKLSSYFHAGGMLLPAFTPRMTT